MADDPRPPAGGPKGPFAPRVWTPPKAAPEEKGSRDAPLVTEGMKARRREMERRRREKALEQLQQEEEAMESWTRVKRFAVRFFFVVVLMAVYARLQFQYQDRWPLGVVWAAMSFVLLGGLGWMVWYINKTE
jgi:hypothetical protein